ncbi:MAG: alpha/beta hydrolase [Clostridia bacterium]|nr:alpha/beta hydrolase [Clostridia bacterium]
MEIITFGELGRKAIVFLHGWGGDFNSFSYFAKELSDKYFCIVVNFKSMMFGDEVLAMQDFADRLKTKLDDFGYDKFTFVGHSFGGRVIAKLASFSPEIIEKVVLISVAGLPRRQKLCYHLRVRWFKIVKWLAKRGLVNPQRLEKFGSKDYRALSPNAKQTFNNIIKENLTKCYKSINVPTLIYWGEKDKETPIYMAKKLNKIIANSGLYVDKNAGHFCYLENPQAFVRAVRIFMEKVL